MNAHQITQSERARSRKLWFTLFGGFIPLMFVASLLLGVVDISQQQLWALLFNDASVNPQVSLIVFDIRLPRALMALLVGIILGSCGAAAQGLFRNPLADPSLIGVTAGASIGGGVLIVISAYLVPSSVSGALASVSIGAFLGAALAVLMVYRISTVYHRTSVTTMLLAGIALTAFSASVTGFLEHIATDSVFKRLSFWSLGSFTGVTYAGLALVLPTAIFIFFAFLNNAKSLNALALGESEARHIGVNVARLKIVLIALISLGVAMTVAVVGIIAFVGLVVPHIARLLIGPDYRYLISLSALLGGLTLMLADLCARTLISPLELPVGLVTSMLGAPFFLYLLRSRARGAGA